MRNATAPRAAHRPLLLLLLLSAGPGSTTLALDNGVGLRPVLGWNSWNVFRDALDEAVVRDTARLLVSTGLAAKGYVFLNMDDTWAMAERNATGWLVADPVKFPTPMAQLVADVHAAGLRFGTYTDVGFQTCAKRAGTYGHETQDASLFASWGVDFVKSDSCFTGANASSQPADGPRCLAAYERFAAALNHTGRPMVHSVKGPCGRAAALQACSPGDASAIANMRRVGGDVKDDWPSMLRVLDDAAALANTSRPGFFADLDILEIGNGGLSPAEERSVFSLWCAVKSPLLLGNDLSKMSAATLATVGNEELLRVNQDARGLAARRVANSATTGAAAGEQVWAGPLGTPRSGGGGSVDEHVVVAFNAGEAPTTMRLDWSAIGVCPASTPLAGCSWDVRDLWEGNVSSAVSRGFTVSVEAHGSVALRLENKTMAAPHDRRRIN